MEDHAIKTCEEFLKLTPDERYEVACRHFYCLNCLACSHNRPNCTAKARCHICDGRHHFLLHAASQMMNSRSPPLSKPAPKRSVSVPPQRRQPSDNRSTSSERLQHHQRPSRARSQSSSKPQQSSRARSPSNARSQHRQQATRGRSPSSDKIQQQPKLRSTSYSKQQRQHAPTRSSSTARPHNQAKQRAPSASPSRPTTSKAASRSILNDRDFVMQPRQYVPIAWSHVFIPTAQIRIAIPDQVGVWHICRASINFNSPVSRIAVSLQSKLNLETYMQHDARFARLFISNRLSRKKWTREIDAMLTNDLPKKPYASPIKENPAIDFPDDSIADPNPQCNSVIAIELGANLYKEIFRNGCVETDVSGVFAQPTALGYVFVGAIEHMQ
ncbi:uncharacterized protein isoform X1 [Musca autumnalis]|uniref:uncharacterized protein isoform X1 n=1 Tax=Musca autumnalis TaxID=221902 RepID=UPI003CEC3CDD